MEKLNFVFLVYVPRSGSTLLARQLAIHSPDIIVLPEFRALEILMGSGEKYVQQMSVNEFIDIMKLDCQLDNLGFTYEDLTSIAQNSYSKGIRNYIENIALQYAAKRQRYPKYVIIKRGDILRFYNQLNNIFPEAKFIHIYRDIRGVTNSTLQGGSPYYYQMGRGDCVFISKRWVKFMQHINIIKTSSKRFFLMEVKYEEICLSSEPIKNIIKFIGANFQELPLKFNFQINEREAGIHRLVNEDPKIERLDAWKKELPTWQGVVVENCSFSYLKNLGYDIYFRNNVSGFIQFFWSIKALILHGLSSIIYNCKRLLFYIKNSRLFLIRIRLIGVHPVVGGANKTKAS